MEVVCKRCGYKEKQNGIFCSDCGLCFIEVIFQKDFYYCKGKEVTIGYNIKHPLDDLNLSKISLSQYEFPDPFVYPLKIEFNHPLTFKTLLKPVFTFRRSDGEEFIVRLNEIYPYPDLTCIHADNDLVLYFDKNKPVVLSIKLTNYSLLKIEEIILIPNIPDVGFGRPIYKFSNNNQEELTKDSICTINLNISENTEFDYSAEYFIKFKNADMDEFIIEHQKHRNYRIKFNI